MSEENSLAVLSKASQMLANVKNASDAKRLRDMASAAEHYAKKAKLSNDISDHAHSIKMEAEAMLGKYLKDNPKNVGGNPQLVDASTGSPTLQEIGLTKQESVDAQFLHALKEKEPEVFTQVRNNEMSLSQARREVKKKELSKSDMPLPSGKYKVIYADPPWSYNDKCDDGSIQSGGAEKHYPSMTILEMCSLPISDLAEDNAVLFLWVTTPLLYDAEPVFKAWGFDYKTCFVWDKVKHNMGHYSSVRHEILLLCTRGSCTPEVVKLFDSVQVVEKTSKHSEKPEEFRKIIDTLYPNGKRLELFSRKAVDGWERWGNENV